MKRINKATYPLTDYLDATGPQPPSAWQGISGGKPVV